MRAETPKPKRFYDEVTVRADGDRFAVTLDGRSAKTTSQNLLTAPNESLAEVIVAEWKAQGEYIDRATMPITSILSAAIDGGENAVKEWTDEICAYLNSDLLCYRADMPEALISLQQQEWTPFLDWIHRDFDIQLIVTSGIVAIEQPKEASMKMEMVLKEQNPETAFALMRATALTGSAVLALALWKKAFPPAQIFEASRLDERFQEERWGIDSEAKEREDNLRSEFHALERVFSKL